MKRRLTNPQKLAKRKTMRYLLGKKQGQLAYMFGVSRTFYNYWENGLRNSSRLEESLTNYYLRMTSRKAA